MSGGEKAFSASPTSAMDNNGIDFHYFDGSRSTRDRMRSDSSPLGSGSQQGDDEERMVSHTQYYETKSPTGKFMYALCVFVHNR